MTPVDFRTPVRRRRYPGWIALAIAALGMVATLPGRTQGLGLITVPLLDDLHLSEVTFGSINLWATLIGASCCIGVGRLVDRFGARPIMTGVVAALGIVVIAMSRVQHAGGLFVTTTLTRALGQSALSVVSLAIVGKWFVRRLPKAMGIYAVLTVFGFAAAFPGVQYAVERFGWRSVWASVGAALLFGVAPVTAMWLRSTPESVGMEADPLPPGEQPIESSAAAEQHTTSKLAGYTKKKIASLLDEPRADLDATLADALSSPAFWAFAIASAMYNFVSSGTSLFNQSILADLHFGSDTFRLLLGITTIAGLVANLIGGWLAEKWPLGRLMGIAMLLQAIALGTLPAAHSKTHIVAYAIATGVAGGIIVVVFFAFWGKIYGRTHLGRIQGAAQLLTVVGSGLGQQLFAQAHAFSHSYTPLFLLLTPIIAILGLICWLAPLPNSNPGPDPEGVWSRNPMRKSVK